MGQPILVGHQRRLPPRGQLGGPQGGRRARVEILVPMVATAAARAATANASARDLDQVDAVDVRHREQLASARPAAVIEQRIVHSAPRSPN